MTITLPCTCENEEHEIEVQPEGQGFYGEPEIGDPLPCGRLFVTADQDKLWERFREHCRGPED
jgi:hypothetical protein